MAGIIAEQLRASTSVTLDRWGGVAQGLTAGVSDMLCKTL